MQTPIKKQTTATATSIEHSLENSAKVISRDICALLGGCEHVASNYDDSAGLKMYASLQEAVWKLPGVLTPGTLQEILPIQPPQPLHHLGIGHTRIFIREFRSMERSFSLFPLWVADYVVKYGKRSRSECEKARSLYQKGLGRQSTYFSMSWHIVKSGREK